MKSNNILGLAVILSIILSISVYFIYRTESWPIGFESLGCLGSIILMIISLLIHWQLRDKIIDELQEKNVARGLGIGLLWTIEICINNLIRPGLPLRDNIDNIFWAIIAILILIIAIREAYLTNKLHFGLISGFWSGIASGAIACLTALIFIVFGMRYLLIDPINVNEWSSISINEKTSGPDVYFAYQTFTGAIMHLFILGAIMGLILGTIGGIIGKILHILKR